MYQIKTYNAIAKEGLAEFGDNYRINQTDNPDAYLIRSVNLHDHEFPKNLKAIARCGAGYNNVPLDKALENGTVVFNTPGGNANAVKELVLASMIIASRNIVAAANWSANAKPGADITLRTEKEKTSFNGTELLGKTVAVIGLGHIGSLVANACLDLGMKVVGYDPYLTVEAAWRLSDHIKRATSIADAVKDADFVTVHVPKNEETTGLIADAKIAQMKPNTILLNFARLGIVDNKAVVEALAEHRLGKYYTDFSDTTILHNDGIVIMPHIGGSTIEAEINCARMAAKQTIEFLETGNIINSVNLPNVSAPFESDHRITLIHKNIPNMIGQISTYLAGRGINIENLVNKAKDKYAYTMIDIDEIDQATQDEVVLNLEQIPAVTRVRILTHKK
ncbi:3-phosphoglycerate dehydrogenase family protein [Lactobacillus delbrueckii]|uniref:3-phosphoglycerate dehydrogenase family protein n=1 Tax=Lactobacillus delbrueckii TaxID=1584 RepID=UPI001E58BC1C|nr:3-phosphoglycerate dehydrogenase family protein [Lactobacillus delbrueckii]MCD5503872.1 3-phosphoglycerate dehydrogenase family protein [Lactobacillus delbrueckii subsp. lactis]